GQAPRRGEQALLGAEEVVDQGGVHARVGGDAPDRRAVISVVAEPGARRGQDRLPRAAVATPAAAPAAPAAAPRRLRPGNAGALRQAGHVSTGMLTHAGGPAGPAIPEPS